MKNQWLLLLPVLLPIFGVLVLQARKIKGNRAHIRWVTGITVLLTSISAIGVMMLSDGTLMVWKLTETLPVYLHVDAMSRFFAAFTIVMWLCSTFFSFAYMDMEEEEGRYQSFATLSFGVLLGLCFSGNLITTYLFYEMMTLATFPLVLHERTKEAISAGLTYLFYSIAGAFLGLVGIFFLYGSAAERSIEEGGCLAYQPGGFLDSGNLSVSANALRIVVLLMIVGLGSKVGMFPLHDWLSKAHPVAPAPASALLSGNITKMGMLFIIRVIYYSVGVDFLKGSWVQQVLLSLALITVFMGSMLAYKEKILKKRLAYSTVSQTSYSLTGFFLMNPVAVLGALMHVLYHSVVKNLLFLCAGAIIFRTGKRNVSELKGIGKKLPVTMWCVTIGALALVGIPPFAPFISKWYLAMGGLESEIPVFRYLVPVILLVSALLTAGYLLTISIDAFFVSKTDACEEYSEREMSKETANLLVLPILFLACLAVLLGLFPGVIKDYLADIVAMIC